MSKGTDCGGAGKSRRTKPKTQTTNRRGTMNQPLKWWGGKSYLAPKLIALMPKHLHYVDALLVAWPFFSKKTPAIRRNTGAAWATSRA